MAERSAFAAAREAYTKKLSLPDYYKPSFDASEIAEITAVTGTVAQQFGYDVGAIAQRISETAQPRSTV